MAVRVKGFMHDLVTTAWLAEALGAPDLRVFDASFYLPTEKIDPVEKFALGHIPGAGFFDIETIADTETQLPHMVPTPGRFERLVAALGISNTSRVVVYDQKGIFSAPRAWWMLRLFGHEHVAVLDGGLPKWRDEGREVAQGVPTPVSAGVFQATYRATMVRGIGDIIDNLQHQRELVLDARAAGRFAGTAPEPRPGLPSGHIPGAKNLPASEVLDQGRVMLPPEALRARLAAAGADGNRPVVTSCGTGVSAATLTLALVRAGLSPGALYDGSWTEWAGRPDTPKEKGPLF